MNQMTKMETLENSLILGMSLEPLVGDQAVSRAKDPKTNIIKIEGRSYVSSIYVNKQTPEDIRKHWKSMEYLVLLHPDSSINYEVQDNGEVLIRLKRQK